MKTPDQIWQRSGKDLLDTLESGPGGLTSHEAARRLERYGPNELREGGKKSTFRIFLEQFADFLVIILILAAVVSAVLGDVESTVVILAVITMNAVLGTVQTVKAEASLDSLKQMSAPTAKVLRDGTVVQIPGREVVPGDIVVLEAGDAVCADGRLLECASLKTAESALTGESLPVEKAAEVIDGEVPLGDRKNMVFSGTFVTYGRGRFLVTGTGMDTEMGKIAALLKSTSEKKTPLQVSLDQFGKKLSIGILILCGLLFAVSVLLRGENVMSAFLFAVALAVAAIPEALSSIVTIVLSFGTRKMAKEHAVIRKLQAVEGLGSVSVICSDKTGTLTQNKMTVRQLYVGGRIIPAQEANFKDPVQEPLLRAALLCSDATVNEKGEIGDPTETALVRLGEDFGFDELDVRDQWPRLGELPFDSDRKLMSTVHRFAGGYMLVTKGAVDVMLDRTVLGPGEREEIERVNQTFSNQGLRVLAFACRRLESTEVSLEEENNMLFLGLIAMMDPPRAESKEAVAHCIAAGIRPIMITGDHVVTASAIAREIGILTPGTQAVEGAVIESMTDQELQDFVPQVSVYARVSPEHKIRIVRAWQERGALVAMTGDGVNDAPALKQADIGVAMGITGTAAAKEAAGMVLADDNFATIVAAVKEGRTVYENLRKVIAWTLPTNGGQAIVIVAAILLGLSLPVTPVQILWVNLVTAVALGLTLAFEPPEPTLMQRKPRSPDEQLLQPYLLWRVALVSVLFALGCFGMFEWSLRRGDSVELARTIVVNALVIMEIFYLFSVRYTQGTSLSLRGVLGTPAVLLGVAGVTLVQLLFTYTPPMQALFDSRPVDLAAGLLAIGLGVALLLLLEVEKLLIRWMRLGVRA